MFFRRLAALHLLRPLAAVCLLVALPACQPPQPAASTVASAPALAPIAVPPALTAALAAYRAGGPKGWAYTQTSEGGGKNIVERFNPRFRGPTRWTLIKQDERTPTEEELRDYRQKSVTKTDGDTASTVRDQLDLATCTLIAEEGRTSVYHFAIRPAVKEDTAAVHMRAAFTLDRPTGTITQVELFNFEPFSPVFTLKIDEARTIMRYTLPEDGKPSLLSEISMKLRGRRLWVRKFSEDMTMRFTEQSDASTPSLAPSTVNTGPAIPQN